MKTKVVHSKSKTAWNVIGLMAGAKYKICRVPYTIIPDSEILSTREKSEALNHAEFISSCFSNRKEIDKIIN